MQDGCVGSLGFYAVYLDSFISDRAVLDFVTLWLISL